MSYRLRLRRKRWKIRAIRRSRELTTVANRTRQLKQSDILLCATLRNERVRLPFFLSYYRALGINHFLLVDNGSDDGTQDYLKEQPDVSLWHTNASYRRARFGVDWLNWIMRRHAHNHWTLTVDADEFFVYPHSDSRPLTALTDWLDSRNVRSFGALLLDVYSKGEPDPYREGENPIPLTPWFDPANYTVSRNPKIRNLWIQGGPRARSYFAKEPDRAPSLNKIPLVKWHRKNVWESSTHSLLPRGLNLVYDEWGGEKSSGCLLHTKYLQDFTARCAEEVARHQHYSGAREYKAYSQIGDSFPNFWTPQSKKFESWQTLEELGLMSRGGWA